MSTTNTSNGNAKKVKAVKDWDAINLIKLFNLNKNYASNAPLKAWIANAKPENKAKDNALNQLLAAMLAAQALNKSDMPAYGTYVNGRNCFFVVL